MKNRILCGGSALLLSASVLAQTDLRQGLVAYLPLDTITPEFTTPELVNTNDFTVVNLDASNLVPGKFGQALQFTDSFDQYAVRYHDLTAPDTGLPITRARAFTVSFWVKGAAGQADRRMFSEGSSTSNNPLFNIGTANPTSTNGFADIFIRNDANTTIVNHNKTVAKPLDGENWHQITYVDVNGAVTIYVDGVQDSTFTYTRPALTADITSIGAIVRATSAAWFTGAIDDVAIWERGLTAAEAQTLFQNGIASPIPVFPALITTQPIAATRNVGDRVTLTADAVGSRPLTLQWLKDGAPIEGATNRTLTLLNVSASDIADYRLQATTPAGDTLSDIAHLTVNPDPAPDLRRGLVSYWPLNTGETNTPDLYSANHMHFVNMDASNFVEGQFGNAISFDGIDEYAFRASGSAIYPATNYTIAFWAKGDYSAQPVNPPSTTTVGDRRIFAEGSSSTTTPLFGLGTDNTGTTPSMNVYIRNDANTAVVNARKSVAPVFDNTWHHIAWVDQNGAAKLYIDGVPDQTDFSYTRGALSANVTAIGAILRTGPSSFFAGAMDDLALWNRALTFAEVQEIKNNGVPAPISAIPPTVTVQPISLTLYQGERIVLTGEATGTAPLTFQWYKGAQLLPGETNKFLNLSNLQPGDAASYSFKVSNAADTVTSSDAVINVTPVTGLRTALVAHWPFETIGATTPDIINGSDLALVNIDESNHIDGKVGKAITLNGTDEYLVRTNEPGGVLPISKYRAYTVSLWANGFGTGQGDRRVFSEGSLTNTQPLLNIGTDNGGASDNVDIFIRTTDGVTRVDHRKSALPAYNGEWHHIVLVDNNGEAFVYVDGQLDPTNFTYTRGSLTAQTTSIGAIVRATVAAYFAGSVDEVALWSRALSVDEVLQVRDQGPNGSTSDIEVGAITTAGSKLQIAVNTSQDTADLKVQSIDTIDSANWTDVSNVAWTSAAGQATAEFDAPNANRFYRIVGAGTAVSIRTLFADDFEGAAQSWTHSGIGDTWDLGVPILGPGVAYSGKNVFGTALDAAYANDTIQTLRTPAIDLTDVASARLNFFEFRDMEAGDITEVNIKDAADPDNGFIAQLSTNTGGRTAWTPRSLELPPEALGRRIVIEFNFTTDPINTLPRAGWFIDNIRVTGN